MTHVAHIDFFSIAKKYVALIGICVAMYIIVTHAILFTLYIFTTPLAIAELHISPDSLMKINDIIALLRTLPIIYT